MSDYGWIKTIEDEWPGPIAHEYWHLRQLLEAGKDKVGYEVVGAMLQLRDFAEVLLKLPAVVIARDAERLGVAIGAFRALLLGVPPSMGHWFKAIDSLAKSALRSPDFPYWTRGLAGLFRQSGPGSRPTALFEQFDGDNGLLKWRNEDLAHGAFRMDLEEIAGDMRRRVIALNHALASVLEVDPWQGLTFQLDGHKQPLVGHESIRRFHEDSPKRVHTQSPVAVHIVHESGEELQLSPYISARVCTECSRQDVFFFNGRDARRRTPPVQYLDYLTGHRHITTRADDPSWPAEFESIDESALRQLEEQGTGSDWLHQATVKLLDRTDFEKEYVEPNYLAEELRGFLSRHPAFQI